jgi:uncharacterized membrane protein
MNAAQLHLAINHFPLFGILIGFFLLLTGYIRKSDDLIRFSYCLLIVIGIAGAIAYFTGGRAEHFIKHMSFFNHDAVEEHEDAGKFGLIAAIILGVFGLVGTFVKRGQLRASKKFNIFTLVIMFWALTVFARVSQLGGEIRHTEVTGIPDPGKQPEANAGATTGTPAPELQNTAPGDNNNVKQMDDEDSE